MARARKVDDADLARLRELHREGWTHAALGREFGVSRQHVGRLVRDEQRPTIAGLDPEALAGGVSGAVATVLEDIELDRGEMVLAVAAHGLAGKLDACLASDSATAAQAVPRVAAQLVDVLDRLRGVIPLEADGVDLLRRRRSARRLAVVGGQAATNGGIE